MNMFRRLIDKYPYRGLFGWATLCMWGFVFAEILWHLSRFVRRYDWLEIPMIVPYAPIAAILDPHDAMMNNGGIFFIALGNWFTIFVIGALFSLRKVNAVAVGTVLLIVLFLCSAGRVTEYWVIHPPLPIE